MEDRGGASLTARGLGVSEGEPGRTQVASHEASRVKPKDLHFILEAKGAMEGM